MRTLIIAALTVAMMNQAFANIVIIKSSELDETYNTCAFEDKEMRVVLDEECVKEHGFKDSTHFLQEDNGVTSSNRGFGAGVVVGMCASFVITKVLECIDKIAGDGSSPNGPASEKVCHWVEKKVCALNLSTDDNSIPTTPSTSYNPCNDGPHINK